MTDLARPVWDSLTTRHAAVARGTAGARRFDPEIGPLAGARDDDPSALVALAALVPETGTLLLLQEPAIIIPPGTAAVTTAAGVQMIAQRPIAMPDDPRIVPLTAADVPAMLALALLTRPGPFAARTHELGEFWGIKDAAGTLLAMAGERLKHVGAAEVSGVCTHPDARGRGFARLLSSWVAARIFARGETPYLHAYASNTAAIALYETLGFVLSREMHVAAIARA